MVAILAGSYGTAGSHNPVGHNVVVRGFIGLWTNPVVSRTRSCLPLRARIPKHLLGSTIAMKRPWLAISCGVRDSRRLRQT